MIARPDAPNPKDPNQMDSRSERETLGLDFGAKGGQNMPKRHVQPEEEMKRDFRNTERLLIEYGFTVGCKGCEAKLKRIQCEAILHFVQKTIGGENARCGAR